MRNRLKRDIDYMVSNHVVSHIPCWTLRRIIYKALGMKIGKGSRIAMNVKVLCPQKIVIGENTVINDDCYLDGRGGLSIGNNCSLSYRTTIISASHKVDSRVFEYYENAVTIEDYVWTGVNATILDGTFIEQGCVLGACSIIKGRTERNGIYLGNPAKLKRKREVPPNTSLEYTAFFR